MNASNAPIADPAATPAAPGTMRVTLKYPITQDGLTCAYLDLRRLKVRDILHADKQGHSDAEKEIIQFASLAGVAPKLIEELDAADYAQVQKVVQGFLQ